MCSHKKANKTHTDGSAHAKIFLLINHTNEPFDLVSRQFSEVF